MVRRLLKQWSEPLRAALCPSLGAHLLEQGILGGSWIYTSRVCFLHPRMDVTQSPGHIW